MWVGQADAVTVDGGPAPRCDHSTTERPTHDTVMKCHRVPSACHMGAVVAKQVGNYWAGLWKSPGWPWALLV